MHGAAATAAATAAAALWTALTICCCICCVMRVLPPVLMRCLPLAYTCTHAGRGAKLGALHRALPPAWPPPAAAGAAGGAGANAPHICGPGARPVWYAPLAAPCRSWAVRWRRPPSPPESPRRRRTCIASRRGIQVLHTLICTRGSAGKPEGGSPAGEPGRAASGLHGACCRREGQLGQFSRSSRLPVRGPGPSRAPPSTASFPAVC